MDFNTFLCIFNMSSGPDYFLLWYFLRCLILLPSLPLNFDSSQDVMLWGSPTVAEDTRSDALFSVVWQLTVLRKSCLSDQC